MYILYTHNYITMFAFCVVCSWLPKEEHLAKGKNHFNLYIVRAI